MAFQEQPPAYTEATTSDEVPPYSDAKQSKQQSQRKPSRMATLKHILKGDAHNNHMAALEAAASSTGIPPKPKKDKSDKQSASKQTQGSRSSSPTWQLIATGKSSSWFSIIFSPLVDKILVGEVHKYNPRFRAPGL